MKIRPSIKYILILFCITRIILTVIGVSSRIMLEPYHGDEYVWNYSDNLILDIWGVWDSGWFLDIASNGYSSEPKLGKQANYAFYPLYPMLMRIIGKIMGNYFLAGIIISNVSILVGCYYFYKLMKLDFNTSKSRKAIKYLLIFPVSFIFSGVFTEAIFFLLAVLCFYYARKSNWFYVGILGFLISLTKALGIFLVIPMLIEYFNKNKFRKDLLWLSMFPLGVLCFMVFNYILTKDALGFIHIQNAWDLQWIFPITRLFKGLFGNTYSLFWSLFTIATLVPLIIYYKKVRKSYLVYAFYSILIPLSTNLRGMPRYISIVFPLYMVFAIISDNKYIDEMMTIIFCLLQGFLMIFWSNGFHLII